MSDLRRLDDAALGSLLQTLGRETASPRTRDLWPGVAERIDRRGAPATRFRWALAAAALLLALGSVLVVSPDARAIAREILRLGGIEIMQGSTSAGPGAPLDLGQRVSLEEAARRLGRPVLVPQGLGAADDIYARSVGSGVTVSLVYRERADIPRSAVSGVAAIITQVRGSLETPLLGKVAGRGTTVELLRVNGNAGAWLQGEPHDIVYRDAAGAVVGDTLRLAGNTLIWEQDGLAIRLEAQLTRDRALALAASVR